MYWKSSPQNVIDHVTKLGITYIGKKFATERIKSRKRTIGVKYIGKKFATDHIRSRKRTRGYIYWKEVRHRMY